MKCSGESGAQAADWAAAQGGGRPRHADECCTVWAAVQRAAGSGSRGLKMNSRRGCAEQVGWAGAGGLGQVGRGRLQRRPPAPLPPPARPKAAQCAPSQARLSVAPWLPAALTARGREVLPRDGAAAGDALRHQPLKLRGALLHHLRRLLVQWVVGVGCLSTEREMSNGA